jgi:hypothetical protein
MERVLLPMEPVEPRMANFFTVSIFADTFEFLRPFAVVDEKSPGFYPGACFKTDFAFYRQP